MVAQGWPKVSVPVGLARHWPQRPIHSVANGEAQLTSRLNAATESAQSAAQPVQLAPVESVAVSSHWTLKAEPGATQGAQRPVQMRSLSSMLDGVHLGRIRARAACARMHACM